LPLSEIQAIGITTSKQLGEAAQAAFLSQASVLGFALSKPWGDSRSRDMVALGWPFLTLEKKLAQKVLDRDIA
jgi:hypothetical protein